MNTDRALRAYQAYSLTKISELNKQTLIAQYAQCEQLNQLNKEMAAANATSNKILQNQIDELKRQEKVRYYKNLAFNLKQILTKIEGQANENFKRFLGKLLLGPIDLFAKDCTQNLEDIQDKEYAVNLSIQANSLLNSINMSSPDFASSAWNRYLIAQKKIDSIDIDSKEKELSKLKTSGPELSDTQIVGRGFWKIALYGYSAFEISILLGTLIELAEDRSQIMMDVLMNLILAGIWWLIYRKYKKVNGTYTQVIGDHKTLIKTKEQQTEILKTEIKDANAEIKAVEGELYAEQPTWHDDLESIFSLLPSAKSDSDLKLDKYFKEAATLAISRESIVAAFIQMKLGVSFNRAEKILAQLEATKIIGPQGKMGQRKVLCHDLTTVDAIIKKYE